MKTPDAMTDEELSSERHFLLDRIESIETELDKRYPRVSEGEKRMLKKVKEGIQNPKRNSGRWPVLQKHFLFP